MQERDTLTAQVSVKNIGECAGTETVQLYIHDVSTKRIKTCKTTEGFQKVILEAQGRKNSKFEITEPMLEFLQ